MSNCGTCRHFGETVMTVDGETGEDYETQYRQCDRVEMYDHCAGNEDGQLALAKDGSGYFAALIVASDFGCVLWRAK